MAEIRNRYPDTLLSSTSSDDSIKNDGWNVTYLRFPRRFDA